MPSSTLLTCCVSAALCSALVQAALAAFDSRMRTLDPAQRDADDDELIVDDGGSDLAQNIKCPITLVPVRSHPLPLCPLWP